MTSPRQSRYTLELQNRVLELFVASPDFQFTVKDIAHNLDLDFTPYSSALYKIVDHLVARGRIVPDDPTKKHFRRYALATAPAPVPTIVGEEAPPAPVIPEPPIYTRFKTYMLQVLRSVVVDARSNIIEERAWQAAFLQALRIEHPVASVWGASPKWAADWGLHMNKLRQYGVVAHDRPAPHQLRVNLRIVLLEIPTQGSALEEYAKMVENDVSQTVRLMQDLHVPAEGASSENGLLSYLPKGRSPV